MPRRGARPQSRRPRTIRIAQRAALFFDVVFDAADGGNFIVEEQIRGARIAVVRKAGASGVGNGHAGEMADVRTVDVGVDDDGRGERTIDGVEGRAGGIGRGDAPKIAGRGVGQCHRTGGAHERRSARAAEQASGGAAEPLQTLFAQRFAGSFGHFPDGVENWLDGCGLAGEFFQRGGPPKAFHPGCPRRQATRGHGFGRQMRRGWSRNRPSHHRGELERGRSAASRPGRPGRRSGCREYRQRWRHLHRYGFGARRPRAPSHSWKRRIHSLTGPFISPRRPNPWPTPL